MSSNRKFDAEKLRPPEYACEPDPRTTATVRWDGETMVPLTLEDYYSAVSEYELHSGVPDEVVTEYEVVRNLYLYSWNVYRFFPVAEHRALTVLEWVLRNLYLNEIKSMCSKPKRHYGLRALLRYVIEKGDITNEGFPRWHDAAKRRAVNRYKMEKMEEAIKQNLTEYSTDLSEVVITEEDRNWDLTEWLCEHLPKLRNDHAHGSTMLHNKSLLAIGLVSEIINQLYDRNSD